MRAPSALPFGWTLVACGAKTDLSSSSRAGDDGSGGSTWAPVDRDPDVDCPLPACTGSSCAAEVLLEGQRVYWHGLHRGLLYFVIDEPGALGPGLYRLDVCEGGGPQALYEAAHVAGVPAFTEDWIYVPVLSPGAIVRIRYDGTGAQTLKSFPESEPEKPRAITLVEDAPFSELGWSLFVSTYSFDGGLFVYGMEDGTGDLERVVGALADGDWPGTPEAPALPNQPVLVGNLAGPGTAGPSFLLPHADGVEELRAELMYMGRYADQPTLSRLVVHDGSVYFTDWDQLYRLPIAPYSERDPGDIEPAEPILELLGWPGGLAAANGWIYLGASYGSPEQSYVYRYDAGTGATEELLTLQGDRARDLVLGSESVYLRTDRRIVRARQSCPSPGDEACTEL